LGEPETISPPINTQVLLALYQFRGTCFRSDNPFWHKEMVFVTVLNSKTCARQDSRGHTALAAVEGRSAPLATGPTAAYFAR
jgi:hypothetical protein